MVAAAAARGSVGKMKLCGRIFVMWEDKRGRREFRPVLVASSDTVIGMLTIVVIGNEQ